MRFTLNGQSFDVEPKDILKKTKNVEPENGRRFFIIANELRYPIKQALSIVTNMPGAAFPTSTAYNILSRLGFTIIDKKVGDSNGL